MRVAIVADDLTGAADSAAPFAARGLSAVVALSLDAVVEADVVALDTDSRAAPAPHRVAEAFRALRAADMLVKKIDSTLRGHVAVEIDAALAATGGEAIVAPAFPAMGRVIRDGRLLVDGADVLDAAARCGREVHDAGTEADLAAIVRAGLGRRVLWVGSAGLTNALATALAPATGAAPGLAAHPDLRAGAPVLVVAGSPSPVTRRQVAAVAEAGVERAADAASAAAALARGADVVVTDPRVGAEVAGLAGALILTGGATARTVLTALGADLIRLAGAPAPGLAAGLAGELPVVLKAGGFGSPRTLLETMRRLRR